MVRAIGSYPIGRRFESHRRYHPGPLVKWSRHRPFTAVTRVRASQGSPSGPVSFRTRDFYVPPARRRTSVTRSGRCRVQRSLFRRRQGAGSLRASQGSRRRKAQVAEPGRGSRLRLSRLRLLSAEKLRRSFRRGAAEAAEWVPCLFRQGTFQFPLPGVERIGIGETDDFYLWLCYNIQERHERG